MDCLRLIKFFNDIDKDVMLSDLLDCVLSAQLINMSENKKEWLKMCNYCLNERDCKCDDEDIYMDLKTEIWHCRKCKCEVN